MRAANSSARSPANTRWPWESTKPGISARPSASIRSPLVALGDLRPDPGDLAGLEQDRGVAQRPQLGVVGDERADVGDQHPTMVPVTSAAVAANTIDSSIVSGSASLQARRGEVERDQVGAEAGRDPAGVVPAQAGVVRGGFEQGARREVAAALGLQPQVELHRARLLEQVDDRVAVAAEREPRTRVPDAVGEVALGRRAHADRGLAQVVGRCQVGGVDRGRVRPERAVLGQQLHGRAARRGEAGLVLGALLGDVEVQRLAARELDDGGELVGRHGADGVDRGADLRALDRARRARPTWPRRRR